MSTLLDALGLGGLELARPLLLAASVPLVAAWLWVAARRPTPALAWPAAAEAQAAGAGVRDPLRAAGLALRALAALACAAALAGPTSPQAPAPETREGLDLVLVVDASGSMRALDARLEGQWRQRLDLARAVVGRFARRRAAEGDRVAVVVFGDTAFTLCPLTSDGALLAAALARLEAGVAGEATALGDALALAVKRVSGGVAEQTGSWQGAPRAGRLIVLLTDGRSNAGTVPPAVAAALAATAGIRVHTVGIGSGGEVAIVPPGAAGLRFERHDLDQETLGSIAERTGGSSFAAHSSRDLEKVYAEIDALERVPRQAPLPGGARPRPEPFLAGAGALLLAELALARVLGRRLP